MKLKIKETYLILLIVISLISLGVYSTYALFTASTEISDVVGITATLDIGKSISEYEIVNVVSGETKLIELNVVNSSSSTIYYGAWYKIVEGNQEDIDIGLYTEVNNNSSSGTLTSSSSINLLVGITNNSSDTITVYLGVKGSTSNELNLSNDKTLLPSGFTLITNLDTSGANSPDLVEGLIPVMYNGSSWVVADYTNSDSDYQWYDYNNKMWANAVLVTETKRNSLNKDSSGNYIAGQTIGDTYDDGTLAFYVWIPRYKYKVWNINKVVGTDSYDAYNTGIDIVFENEKSSTGTITCTYSYASPSSTAGSPNEVCTGSNGDYYTHPAFTFGSEEVRGFWIGKFEVSSDFSTSGYGGGNSAYRKVRILPNVTSWRFNSLSNFNTVVQNMQVESNVYGLNTSRTDTDSHILTNYEWGAVAYLTNSNYGRCTNGSCSEVAKNGYGQITVINNPDNDGYVTQTGCGPISSGSNYGYDTICNSYNTTIGMTASTTGNITGVYDMSGGALEYVMGKMSSETGGFTFYSSGGGYFTSDFSSDWYTTSTAKYLTTYAYGTSSIGQTAYNRVRLGDATGEVTLTDSFWYSDTRYLFYGNGSGPITWLRRGGYFNDDGEAGIFSSYYADGLNIAYISTRAALIGLS